MNEIKAIRENLSFLEATLETKEKELHNAQCEADRYKAIVLEFLQSKIGQKIYWAHKNWRKYERHTITDVCLKVQDNDFFGKEYLGEECIRIYLEDGGYFIADQIGKTLFFDEHEASTRTCKED